jgi:hypothetical protein
MTIEIPIFKTGTYDKPCELFSEIKIGSVLCVGHPALATKGCKYCVSYKEENSYYLEILKENTPIVSEVLCNRPGAQLLIF